MSEFANPFDAAMAAEGPPAVFVRTDEASWRLDDVLSRDAWERNKDVALARDPAWVLVRDRATGFVGWWFTTGRALLEDHPRVDVRFYGSEAEAEAALEALGRPAIAAEGWG